MSALVQDLKYAARILIKSPAFTAVVVLTLALGIGANTAIFSLVDAVMLQSLPVRDPRQLVLLQWHAHQSPRYDEISSFGDCRSGGGSEDNPWGCSFSSPMFDAIRADTNVFDGVAAFAGPSQLSLSGNGPARMIRAEIVSGDFFHTLGVRAALGRTIQPEDDTLTAAPVAVLSYGYWQSAFGGAPSVIGSTIRLTGVPFTIVGVAEPKFARLAPGKSQDLWLARSVFPRVGFSSGWSRIEDPGNLWLAVLARLKPGIPLAQAQAAVSLAFRNELAHGSKPLLEEKFEPSIVLVSAQDGLTGARRRFETPLMILMFAVGTILLIACANVAGLLLARSAARHREIAIRLALGASRSRIARQLFTESLLLSGFGGVLGAAAAYWGVRAVTALVAGGSAGQFPFTVVPNIRILFFTAAVSVITGILFGLAPALASRSVELMPALKVSVGRSAGHTLMAVRWLNPGNALVVGQIALTVVVLGGAGLFVRTLANVERINPGFDARNILLFVVDPALSGYNTAKIQNLYRQLQSGLAAVPGVISASFSNDALLTGGHESGTIAIEGQPENSNVDVDQLATGPGFFDSMRIPILEGRAFQSSDFAEAPPPFASPAEQASGKSPAPVASIVSVVINEAFVRSFFPTQDPLGRRLTRVDNVGSNGGTTEGKVKSRNWVIVGVVADAKYSDLRQEIRPTVYRPVRGGGAYFEIRTLGDSNGFVPVVWNIVARIDNNLPIIDITTESEEIDYELSQERTLARLSSFFGVLALILACVGVYALLAYEVTRRTREIGIRMAPGAQRGDTLRLVVGKGMILTLAGAAIGVAAAAGITRYLASVLYGVPPADAATFTVVVLLLLFVAVAACWIPARRAMRIDPQVALRHE